MNTIRGPGLLLSQFIDADERLSRVLKCDPGMGIVRHADAGYPEAIACARERGVDLPMLPR